MLEKNQHFLIWGARGHAKVLDEIIRLNHCKVSVLVDVNPIAESPLPGIPVLHGHNGYVNWVKDIKNRSATFNMAAIAAIGGSRGKDRVEYYEMFRLDGFSTPSLIHPLAHVTDTATVADNCHVCAFAFIGAEASVAEACIINTKASVDHDSVLGRGVHIAPGAILCGCVSVGDFTFVGAGATILPNINIGSNVIIGAGALVTRDVPNNVLVYGNPARVIRKFENA